jgi:hypothetical protein
MCISLLTSVVKCFTEWKLGNQFNEHIFPFGEGVSIFAIFVIACYLVRICIFFYMISVFYETLSYFVELKRMVLETQLLRLSCFNYFMITSVVLLTLVRVSDTLTTDVITIIRIVKDVYQDSFLEKTWLICRMLVLPLRDLFELLMISYMIYYQDQRQKTLESIAPQQNQAITSRLNGATHNVGSTDSSQLCLKKMILSMANQQRLKLESIDINEVTVVSHTSSGVGGGGNQAGSACSRKLTSYPIETWQHTVMMTSDGADPLPAAYLSHYEGFRCSLQAYHHNQTSTLVHTRPHSWR